MKHDSRELEDTLEIYRALRVCCTEAMELAKRNAWKNLAKKLEATSKKTHGDAPYSKRDLENLFDNHVMPILDEVCFIDLVRVFERIVFELVDNASGEIKKTIKGSKANYPFYLCAEKFVKSSTERDIRNLGDIQEILKGGVSNSLYDDLGKIVKYRNWLAHGNRFKDKKDQAARPGEMDWVLDIFKEILTRIRPIT
ncbi:MAG: hypothetical protein WC647_12000 [Desulfomonilaceae bacterium]